jgi:hypothetical protein
MTVHEPPASEIRTEPGAPSDPEELKPDYVLGQRRLERVSQAEVAEVLWPPRPPYDQAKRRTWAGEVILSRIEWGEDLEVSQRQLRIILDTVRALGAAKRAKRERR